MTKFILLLSVLFSFYAQGAAVIFSGNEVKALKPNLNLFDEAKILTGSVNPTAVATDAPTGSLYLNTTSGSVYRKLDDGLTDNWLEILNGVLAAEASTDNAIPRYDGITGELIQNSGVLLDDSDNMSGINDLSIAGTATVGSLDGILRGTAGALSAGLIFNSDIDAAAAISFSKMEALTADRVLISDASGIVSPSSVTTTTLGFVDPTSSIQTQLDSKASGTDLTDHIADTSTHGVTGDIVGTTDTQTLSGKTVVVADNTVTTAASGNLSATELNAALAELQGDVDTRALDSDLDAHTAATTTVHGIADTSTLLTEDNVKTVTGKSIDADDNPITDLTVGNIKTEIANADQVISFDPSGAPQVSKVTNGLISSGSELVGKVLKADGAGGVAWEKDQGDFGKNYVTDPHYDEEVTETRGYRELSFENDGGGGFTDGGGLGYIIAFAGHGLTTGDRVFYYTSGTALDGSATLIGIEGYANVLDANSFGISLTNGGANVLLSDSGGVGSTHYFRIYQTPDHLTASVETTNPQARSGSLKITFDDDASTAQGEGIEINTLTIDKEDFGKPLYLRTSVDATSANYESDNLVFKVIDKTNSKLINLLENFEIQKVDDGYVVQANPSSDTSQVLLSVHVESDSVLGDYDAIFGTWSLGVDTPVPGFIGGYLGEETWTDSDANATTTVRLYREGRILKVVGKTAMTGNLSGTLSVTVPSTYAPDYTFSSEFYNTGLSKFIDVSAGPATREGVTQLISATELRPALTQTDGTFALLANANASQPWAWASGDMIKWDAQWPVAGWDASAMLSTTELMTKTTDVWAVGNAGQSITATTTNVPFTEVSDSLGEWDGDEFRPIETGRYRWSGNMWFTASLAREVGLYEDGVSYKRYSQGQNDVAHSFEFEVEMTAGKAYSIRTITNGGTLSNAAGVTTLHYMSIKRSYDPRSFATYPDTTDVELYVDTGNGHGSTNTKIRRYTNSRKNTLGIYATYADSATLGASVTINIPGIYRFTRADSNSSAASQLGWTVNGSALTTNIFSVSYAQGFRSGISTSSGINAEASFTARLSAGDIVRPHGDGTSNVAGNLAYMQAVRLGP